MKNAAFLAVALILILFVSACEKKIITERSYTENKMNNKTWESDEVYALFVNGKIGMSFQKYKKVEGVELVWYKLGLDCLDKKMGKQTLHYMLPSDPEYDYQSNPALASYNVAYLDGDVICDDFRIYEADSVNNWIEITEEEDDFRHIKGRYSMTLTKWITCDESVTDDTLVIREGVFDVYLE